MTTLECDLSIAGERPIAVAIVFGEGCFLESGCLGLQPEVGGKLHLRLNTTASPIANKYREGQLKRTLKREFKVRETAQRQTGRTWNNLLTIVLFLCLTRSWFVKGQW